MKQKLLTVLVSLFMFTGIAVAGDSASNRGDSFLMVTVNPVGIDLRKATGAMPVDVGIYLGESLILGATAANGTWEEDNEDSKTTITYTNSGAFIRAFPGNSFNLFASYNQGTWDGEFTVIEASTSATGTFKAEATVAMFGLGNHWLLDSGITIGADWVFGGTILDSSTTVTYSGSTLSADDKVEADKDLTEIGDILNDWSASPGAVNFFIGFSF